MAPLSSKMGASAAVWRRASVKVPVRPRVSCGVSTTSEMKEASAGMMPVKIWPCSKRRTVFYVAVEVVGEHGEHAG